MNYLLDKIKICLTAREAISNFPTLALMQIEQDGGLAVAEEYMSGKMMGYRQNYVFKPVGQKEGAIYIGLQCNTYKEHSEGLKKVVVEWNPNKVAIPLILKWWLSELGCRYSEVLSCDVAIDLHFPLDQVRIKTNKKMMFVGQSNNLTRYVAPQEAHNRIKIYDKIKERQRIEKQDISSLSPLTRVEISLKKPLFHEHPFLDTTDMLYLRETCSALSEIFIPVAMPMKREKLVEKYGRYDPALCYLLENADEQHRLQALSLLSEATRAKYRAWLASGDYEPLPVNHFHFANDVGRQILQAIYSVCSRVNFIS